MTLEKFVEELTVILEENPNLKDYEVVLGNNPDRVEFPEKITFELGATLGYEFWGKQEIQEIRKDMDEDELAYFERIDTIHIKG